MNKEEFLLEIKSILSNHFSFIENYCDNETKDHQLSYYIGQAEVDIYNDICDLMDEEDNN